MTDNEFNPSNNQEYFDRAQFYFDRAIDSDPGSYTLFKHAGYFSQYCDNKVIASRSKSYFEKTSDVGMQFQKPLVSIALVELEAFNDSFSTLAALRKARNRKKYDTDSEGSRYEYISYLEACALCLRAQKENGSERADTLKESMEKLSEAANRTSVGWGEIRGFFQSDRDKYFAVLKSDPQTAGGFDQCIRNLEKCVYEGD